MMSNVFKNMGRNAQHILLLVFPLAIMLIGISLVLMVEDFRTSLRGYQALPTTKVDTDWVPYAVAALPQVGQIVLAYIVARNTQRRWAGVLAFGFFLVDIGTDITYKINGNLTLVPIAFMETLFIFTLGSEVLFTLAVGFVAETFAEFIALVAVFVQSILAAIETMVKALVGGEDANNSNTNANNRNEKQGNGGHQQTFR